METISTAYVGEIIKDRPYDMHKGQAGRVLLIAGSKGMAGAAVLSARGALYAGAGIVKVGIPCDLFNILQVSVPEAMCVERETIHGENLSEFDAVALGPGLGNSKENCQLIVEILESFKGPVVVDADGINSLCTYGGLGEVRGRKETVIYTPHPGEADRMLYFFGCPSCRELGREEAARVLAQRTGAIVVLKGAQTLVAYGNEIYMNTTGNPGMATGGSGDVLTGITASLLGQKHLDASQLERVNAAVHIHGLAGDLAAENIGEYGMTAADIADSISLAMRYCNEL